MLWQEPWAWLAAGLLLAILEIVVPGYIFLGFGLGAALVAGGLMVSGPEAGFAQSLPLLFLTFAIASLVAWLGLRRVLGIRRGQVKVFDRDINED
jgi:membrane protein implicated in regulation of membrane protease activity